MNKIYEFKNVLKHVAKKSKRISFTLVALISLLMNGEISSADLVYGKFRYKYNRHSTQLGINIFLEAERFKPTTEIKEDDDKEIDNNDDTNSNEYKVKKFKKYKKNNPSDNEVISNGSSNILLPMEKSFTFQINNSVNPKINTINTVKLANVDIPIHSISIGAPAVFQPNIANNNIKLDDYETAEVLKVAYQEQPVYKQGFSKKYKHYFLKSNKNTTYDEATFSNIIFLNEDGTPKRGDEQTIRMEEVLKRKKFEFKSDNIIEKYTTHYGNLITQLDLTEGIYNLYFKGHISKLPLIKYENDYSFGFKVENGSFTNTTDDGENTFPENYEGEVYAESFYRSAGRLENIIGENVVVNVVGKFADPLVHKKKVYKDKFINEIYTPNINSVYYLSNPTVKTTKKSGNKYEVDELNPNKTSTLIHRGTTNIYGNKINVVNIDDVSSKNDTIFKNEGKIIGHNEKGMFNDKEGSDPETHIFGTFTYSDSGKQIIHNTEKGQVLLHAPKSMGIIYTSDNNQYTEKSFINDGEFKLYGLSSSGIIFNNDNKRFERKQVNFANIQLNKPLEILGDNSVGISFTVQPEDKVYLPFVTEYRSSNTINRYTGESFAIVGYKPVDTYLYTSDYLTYNKTEKKYYYKGTGEIAGDNPDSKDFVYKDLEGNIGKRIGNHIYYDKDIISPIKTSKFKIKIGSDRENFDSEKSGNKVGGDENFVENSIGLNFDYKINKNNSDIAMYDFNTNFENYNNYQIELGETSKKSVGVRVANAMIQLDENSDSFIKLNGENNIAILADGILPDTNGTEFMGKLSISDKDSRDISLQNRGIIFNNTEHNITDSGKNNIIFASLNSGKIEILNKFNANFNTEGISLAYSRDKVESKNRISNIFFKKGITGNVSGNKSVLFYADDSGVIDINVAKPTEPIDDNNRAQFNEYNATPEVNENSEALEVTGEDSVTFYAKNKGVINATKTYIKAKDTSSVIVSSGDESIVNIYDSIIDYDGDSYAIFSENNGKINFENSKLILRGNSIALNQSQLVNIDGLTITAMSNNIYASTAKDLGETNLTNLITFLNLQKVNIVAGEENGVRYDKYKDIFIDGITLNIDKNIDKKEIITTNDESDPAYKLIKKYAIQKAKINLKNGNNIITKLDTNDLTELNRKYLIGYDLTGSGSSTSNSDTVFTQEENTEIIVDRTDEGRGGVGLFINYGKIITKENSKISVEKAETTSNDNAIGIVAVNGSEVENSANITVGGNNSFGILAKTYRKDENDNIKSNEFSGKDKKGQVFVENKGNIELDGNSSVGIFVEKNADVEDADEKAHAINSKNINLSGTNSIGMYAKEGTITNKGKIETVGEDARAMVGKVSSTLINDTTGSIIVDNTNSPSKIGIAMAAIDDDTKIINKGSIEVKKLGYGIYGSDIKAENSTIKVGEGLVDENNADDIKFSVGIFSKSEGTNSREVNIDNNTTIETKDYGIAVYTVGNAPLNIGAKNNIILGNNSYSYYINSDNTTLLSKNPRVDIKNNSIHILSLKNDANITNETEINIIGKDSFGIYGNGNITNLANIDLSASTGSIALYAGENATITNGSTGANAISPIIKLGTSSPSEQKYSIGMATGDSNNNKTGTIINYGTIEATKDNSVAMYASGANSIAKNYGKIKLSGNKSIGMYLENGATGENHGTIEVVGSGSNIIGVVAKKGTTIKNYGTINISGNSNKGVYLEKDATLLKETGTITATNGAVDIYDKKTEKEDTEKIKIVENTTSNPPTITINDVTYDFAKVDNVEPINQNDKIKINDEIRDKAEFKPISDNSNVFAANIDNDTLGLYVDTSGINFTSPFNGIENIENLKKIELIIGNEATKYSDKNVIEVGENILKPYNDMLATQSDDKTFEAISSSYIWNVVAELNDENNKVEKLYLVKTPFKDLGQDDDTKEFLEVLDIIYPQKSNNKDLEKIFNKINNIGKGEGDVLSKTIEELRGNIYSTTSRRIKDAKNVFDTEFNTVKDWSTDTRKTTKFKLFGDMKLHKSKYAGLIDYDKYTYGIYGINENYLTDTTNSGMFFGVSYDKFNFKDEGKSVEKAYNAQIGYFRDELFGSENKFKYHVKLGLNGSYRNMTRNANIVDEIVSHRAKYYNIGGFIDQEVSMKKKFANNVVLETKLGLDLGYSRTNSIIEKDGAFNLSIKPHNVFTVIPRLSVEVKNERELDKLWSLLYNVKFEINKDFGYMIEKQMRAKTEFDDKEYNLVKDNHLFSAIISAKIGLNRNEKNHSASIMGSYDFGTNSLKLGAEAKFNLDRYREEEKEKVVNVVSEDNTKKSNDTTEIIQIIPEHCSLNEKECNIQDFKVNGRQPEKSAINFIKEIVEIINKYAIDGSIDITGHTDHTASVEYNQKLSEDRANSIAKLLREYGLKTDVVFGVIDGKSENEPVDTNETVRGRFNNRRVVIKFYNVNYKHEMNKK